MPAEIRFEIRHASISAPIRRELPPEGVKKIAQVLNIPKDKVRYGKLSENDFYDEKDSPNFSVKFVLVETGDQLKVGYFEFMPPSIFDYRSAASSAIGDAFKACRIVRRLCESRPVALVPAGCVVSNVTQPKSRH